MNDYLLCCWLYLSWQFWRLWLRQTLLDSKSKNIAYFVMFLCDCDLFMRTFVFVNGNKIVIATRPLSRCPVNLRLCCIDRYLINSDYILSCAALIKYFFKFLICLRWNYKKILSSWQNDIMKLWYVGVQRQSTEK